MLLDSHRLRFDPDPTVTTTPTVQPAKETTVIMPCSERFAAALEETEVTPDGVRMYTWRAVRRQQLRKLRQPVRWIVLMMALMEIASVTSVFDLVYQGKHGSKAPGPEDYGIAHTAGYLLSWLLMCILAVLWVPLFSWWVPNSTEPEPSSDPTTPTSTHKSLNNVLYKVDLTILTLNILVYLGTYIYHLVQTFIHVGPKPHSQSLTDQPTPLNTRKAWGIRALLFSTVCTSLALGKCIFTVLEGCDLAKVKPLEYAIIIVPIQINLGILMGSAVQFRAEVRRERLLKGRKRDAEVAAVVVGEKERLLEI